MENNLTNQNPWVSGSITISIANQQLTLLPQKMVWWAARKTLLVADTHFGKANTFRRAGIPVPEKMTKQMLSQLSDVVDRHDAKRLIILGDLVHAPVKGIKTFEKSLASWRDRHAQLDLVLVQGNHDRGHQGLFERLRLRVVTEPFVDEPFALCHYPDVVVDRQLFKLAGHVHPAIHLGKPFGNESVPCFHVSSKSRLAILPAFGEFTGCHRVVFETGDEVYGFADGEVVDLSKHLDLS